MGERKRIRHSTPTVDDIARVLYTLNPARQPWNGDPYGFYESGAEHERNRARVQARAVIAHLDPQPADSSSGGVS